MECFYVNILSCVIFSMNSSAKEDCRIVLIFGNYVAIIRGPECLIVTKLPKSNQLTHILWKQIVYNLL